MSILFFALGLGLLVLGAELLVRGASRLALLVGISPLVVGLTVVAFGTSSPELAVSVQSALAGQADIAIGNVVGSNIFNIFGVLGASGLAAPAGLTVAPAVLSFDLLVMLAVAVVCLPVFFTGRQISRWEGGMFLAYYAAYTAYLILYAQQHDALVPFSIAMLGFVVPLTLVTLGVMTLREWRSSRGE